MNFRRQAFLGLATAMLLCISATTAFPLPLRISRSWTQRKVSSGKFPIHSACMMPPEGRLTRIVMKGAEGMSKESEAWAGAIDDIVASHLKSDGITIYSAISPLSSGASDDEIRSVISQIKQKLSAVEPLMEKKPGGIEKSAYTLGDQVGMLPCSEKSDILVFVEGEGQVLTGGRATESFLIGGPAEGAVILVTMADAKTGEIVGLIRIYAGAEFVEYPEDEIGGHLDYQLANMNIGTARKNEEAHQH